MEILKDYSMKLQEFLKLKQDSSFSKLPQMELINDDFLNYDWSESSLVFANSTCFSQELMSSIANKAEELKQGSIFVTFTKKLPDLSDKWLVCDGFRRLMSWGIATVYVHKKIL